MGKCRADGGIGDHLPGWRTHGSGNSHRHTGQPFDSGWANLFPKEQPRHLHLEPWRYA